MTPLLPCQDCNNRSERVTTLEQLLIDVGLTTVLQDMRTQGQERWDETANVCRFQPLNLAETDIDRLNPGECGGDGKLILLELILASIFANGLSRYGIRHAFDSSSVEASNNAFQWQLKSLPKLPGYHTSLLSRKPDHNAILLPPADSQYVRLRMRVQVVGYAWYTSGFSDYVAITVVVIYMLVALVHTV